MSTEKGVKNSAVFYLFNGTADLKKPSKEHQVFTLDEKQAYSLDEKQVKLSEPGTFSAFFKGGEIKTLDQFYSSVLIQLKLPDYFSFNLDSLDELIHDLSWISEKKKKIIITEYDRFLIQESETNLINVLSMLHSWLLHTSMNEVWIEDGPKARKDLQLFGFVLKGLA